jgi:protease I
MWKLGLVSLLIFIGCEKEVMKMDKKVAIIVASDNFRDEEFTEPKELLEEAGVEIVVASSSLKVSRGYFGTEAKPEILIDDLRVDDFDAIIFVGGSGAQEYFDNLSAHRIAVEAIEKDKILAAICIAPSILANAKVLSGKRVTSFSSEKSNLQQKGAIYTGASVEVDGKIVTADGPKSAKEFGEAILKLLKE